MVKRVVIGYIGGLYETVNPGDGNRSRRSE